MCSLDFAMPATDTPLITAKQFFEMQFDESVELVRGRVVPKYRWRDRYSSQAIGSVLARLVTALSVWADAGSHGVVAVGVELDTLALGACPSATMDIAVYASSVLCDGKFGGEDALELPSLGVITLHPDDCFAGAMDRLRSLLAAGVKEVWLVDYSSRYISVGRPRRNDMGLWDENQTIKSAQLPGFEHPVRDLFVAIQRPPREPHPYD